MNHVARGRMIAVRSCFDSGAKVGIESDRNHVSGTAFERRASSSAWFERVDVDVTGDFVGECFDVGVAEHASGLGDAGLGWGVIMSEVSSREQVVKRQSERHRVDDQFDGWRV